MPNIYLRHATHGAKVAISWLEAREDMEHGWEEFDPSDPDDSESPASAEIILLLKLSVVLAMPVLPMMPQLILVAIKLSRKLSPVPSLGLVPTFT